MSCVFRKKSKKKNTNWKLGDRLRGKSGRGEKLVSGKTHGDIPQSESDVVTPGEKKSKLENPLRKLYNKEECR